MKRFVLFNSPIDWDFKAEQEQYLSPLGLGYIATYLEKNGIDAEVVDCVKDQKSVAEVIEFINTKNIDYIGINVFTLNYKIVKYIFENIKTKCTCFIGGQVVKNIYKEILEWNVKNELNIIIGDGEFIIPALVLGNCIQKPEEQYGQKKVYRVNNTSKYFPQDISGIYLNRKYLGDEVICNHYGQKEIAIITSRGCMFDCAFCGGARSLNKDTKIRIRTPESVKREIEDILSVYTDIRSIRVLDDLFLRDEKSIDMANNIFCNFPQLSWRGMVHALSLVNSLDKVKNLRNGNCKELFMGIESGSERIRKQINKLGSVDEILKVATEIMRNGIDLKGYFIYGFPKENRDDFQKTFELALKLKEISRTTKGIFRTSVFPFKPYHGTKLYNDIMAETGIIHEYEINNSINKFEGRVQFNFDSGNYSAESNKLLSKFIIKTQRIGRYDEN